FNDPPPTEFYTLSLHDALPICTSRDKERDASRLGAKHFVATKEPGALDALQGRFNLIVDTISAQHDLNQLMALLRSYGTMVLLRSEEPRLNSSHLVISYAVFCL